MSRCEYTATKEDWETSPMPEKNASFTFWRHFTKKQLACLRRGHIPDCMEDRWFSYCEGNKLYIHRSWSGSCIYIVALSPVLGRHRVTVNRDEQQYTCTDIREDKQEVDMLLRQWC